MPVGTNGPLPSRPARNGEPRPAPPPTAAEPQSAKRDLASWWKQFGKRSTAKKEEEEKDLEVRSIFGVPLFTSIPYANVAISLFNETGESYIYGYVPIVVAKCGVFLKEKATDVEGIFRLAGSEKRIKELKLAFDTPPRWGKGLDWTGYTVHDAANILRRYFNQLPEPIIPLQHYESFREPLRGHQAEAVGQIEGQAPSVGGFDPDEVVRIYQHLIKELPSLNRQLLLYILDLLAVFAAKADVNKMTTHSLAVIFQPGILSHPQHDMSPQDYRLSQDVLIFLIDNQDHFLIGMEGTAVDEGTAKHVQSGPSTPQPRTPTTPGRRKSGVGRSASAASSAAAESLRKFGGVRRNVSTSSKQSRHSGAVASPTPPSCSTPAGGAGVHRSNTVPSKRSPAIRSTTFGTDKSSGPSTPQTEEPRILVASEVPQDVPLRAPPAVQPGQKTPQILESEKLGMLKPLPEERIDPSRPGQKIEMPLPQHRFELIRPTPTDVPGAYPLPSPDIAPPSSEDVTPTAPGTVPPAPAAQTLVPPTSQNHGRNSPQLTPTRERSEFVERPLDAEKSEKSAETATMVRTFTQILSRVSPSNDEKKEGRRPNKLQKKPRLHGSTNPSAHSSTQSLGGLNMGGLESPSTPLPHHGIPQQHPSSSKEALQSFSSEIMSGRNSGTTLKPTMSPSASFRSHSTATEYSEAEGAEEPPKEEKRSFWKAHRRGESKAAPQPMQTDVFGSGPPGAERSMSSFASSSGRGARQSVQYDSYQAGDVSPFYGSPDSKDPERKSGFSNWLNRHKDREGRKQGAFSPPGSSADLMASQRVGSPHAHDRQAAREQSMEALVGPAPAEASKESNDVTPTGTNPEPSRSSAQLPTVPNSHPPPVLSQKWTGLEPTNPTN